MVEVEGNVNIKKISYLISFSLPTGIYRPFQNHPRNTSAYVRPLTANAELNRSRVCRIRGLQLNNYHVVLSLVTCSLPLFFSYTMSTPPKIGGEYGEIRATIDIDTLNVYLAKNTPGIKTPVDVKQFKVWLMIVFLRTYAEHPVQ